MRMGWVAIGTVFALTVLVEGAEADGSSRFVIPKSREAWERQKGDISKSILESRPKVLSEFEVKTDEVAEIQGIHVERFHLTFPRRKKIVHGLFARKAGPVRLGELPGVLFLADGKDAAMRPGLDGLPPALEIARRGMGVLWIEAEPTIRPSVQNPGGWNWILETDMAAIEVLVHRPEIDSNKIGAIGIGLGGTRAVWVMGLDHRIGYCKAIGGLSRIGDLTAQYRDEKMDNETLVALSVARRTSPQGFLHESSDTDTLVALCAGRFLDWTVGDRDPSSPESSVTVVETVGHAMATLVGNGHGFHVTHLGRQDERYGRLQWMGAMEMLDKAFFPHGPTPLGHAPEPEPEVTAEFIDLAPHGLAGWVPEMSQRPGTWTWTDGVIACKPGKEEYGWLRAPIEVGDFILTAEWKVPVGGNSGIFLRAKPVPWNFPPSQSNKQIVSALGLDWPSRTGLELQAQDDHGQADKYTSGSLYRHAATAENPTHPAGQWNKFTVRSRGMRVEVWSNGKQILDARIDECPLTLPNPPARGYIGLQNHGSPGEFRNLKLRRL